MTAFADHDEFDPSPYGVIGEPIEIKPRLADAEEFPLDRMPPRLAGAIRAIVDIVQVPVPIAAQAILGACSLVAQTRIMVEMPTREVVPTSLFLFTVAASGERKTSADKLALAAIYDHERDLRYGHEEDQRAYTAERAAYDVTLAAAKKTKGPRDVIRDAVAAVGSPPTPPALPMLLVEEPTVEGIVKLLDEAWPSIGLFSDEGAKMLGGYSMQEDRQASTGASLSQLWDGKPIKRVRGTDVTKVLDGRRMSLHLMVQSGVASKLFGNKALRDQGMLSRMLVAAPKSMKGQRLWREPAEQSFEDLEAYKKRLAGLLRQAFSRIDPQTRAPQFDVAALQPAAREMWIKFSDHMEGQQGPNGPLVAVSDLASKMAQHALRLAAVIAYFENGEKVAVDGISDKAMAVGIALGEFYLAEALRLFNAGSVSEDSDNADALIAFIRAEQLTTVGKRWLSRFATPAHLRPAEVLQRAIELLVLHGHLVAIQGGATFRARGKEMTERNAYTVIQPVEDK